ncbi:DUF1801 domain-containing protein [Marasmitruncus massiliensis]|uniref:DUF1801 domain-containing protein n=1 Tax=Marasmitruncus massiliensis TaxID=1944642 RepID=UPI0015E06B7F
MAKERPATIDDYIAGCNPAVQPALRELRRTIAQAAPEAAEKISWGMATFSYQGNLVHFSAEKKHIGFHPAPSAIEAFQTELADYHCSKGTVRFPYEEPLPLDLIRRMVRFRVEEQIALAEAKKAGGKSEKVLRPRYPIPDDVAKALQREGLTGQYEARPPYQRNDYIGWITQAKRTQTREKRIRQMLDELRSGDIYMGMAYSAKK